LWKGIEYATLRKEKLTVKRADDITWRQKVLSFFETTAEFFTPFGSKLEHIKAT